MSDMTTMGGQAAVNTEIDERNLQSQSVSRGARRCLAGNIGKSNWFTPGSAGF